MMKRVLGIVLLVAAVSMAGSLNGWAQGTVQMPLEKAVMSGAMAKRALTKYQISSDIAQQIVDACVGGSVEKKSLKATFLKALTDCFRGLELLAVELEFTLGTGQSLTICTAYKITAFAPG